jgi:hypothetical protein
MDANKRESGEFSAKARRAKGGENSSETGFNHG